MEAKLKSPEISSMGAAKSRGFQWNLVGWFASSLGASAWMLITPFFLSWPVKGVFAGIVGTLLIRSFSAIAWGCRNRVSAFKSIVGLLSFTVLSNLGFLLFAHVNELPLKRASQVIETHYGLYYSSLLALFLSLLVLFWVREHQTSE